MLYPAIPQELQDRVSRYSLVIATAKRARSIYKSADDNEEILLEKPVKIAITDIAENKIVIKGLKTD